MYQKVLVPVDGSELAECVLPHVEAIAKGCQPKKVILIRVVETGFIPSGWDEYPIRADVDRLTESVEKPAAEDYLKQLAGRLKLDGVSIETQVTMGKPAETIADYAVHNEIDLIVIATHGRSGVGRWVMGSVADRVLRSACVPVLMVRPPECVPNI